MTVTFTSCLSAAAAPLKHAWEHTVGSSRAVLALRADWQEQLHRCHDELGFRHFRFHGLLTDDMGTLISHQQKPVYRAFQLLHGLGSERLPVAGTHETVDAWVVRKGRSITVFLTNHAQPRHAIVTRLVGIRLTDAPAPLTAYIERIDEDHANPRRRWREMGEPEYPSRSQVEQFEAASRLVKEPFGFTCADRTVRFDVDLPPHSVAAATLEFAAEPSGGGAATGAASTR